MTQIRFYKKNRDLMLRWQQGRCYLCGRRLGPTLPLVATSATVDHIKPRGLGGIVMHANIAMSCHACNSMKRTRPPTACEVLFGQLLHACLFPWQIVNRPKSSSFDRMFGKMRRLNPIDQRPMRLW